MKIRITWDGGSIRQLDGVEAEKTTKQLDSENDFIEFNFEGWKTRVYKQYIVSVEWWEVKE